MLFFLFENRMKFSLLCILAGGKKEIIIFLTPQRKMLAGQNAILPVVLCKKKEIQCPGRTHKSCSKPDRRLRGEMPKNPASENSGLGAELVCS